MDDMMTVAEVAAVLKVSPGTVVKIFAKMPGVKNLGTEGSLNKRRRRLLRIPRPLVERYVGHPITVPAASPKRQKYWEHHAARSLAKSMKANAEDPRDRELYQAIQSHARMLTFVDEGEWDQLSTQFNFPAGEDE